MKILSLVVVGLFAGSVAHAETEDLTQYKEISCARSNGSETSYSIDRDSSKFSGWANAGLYTYVKNDGGKTKALVTLLREVESASDKLRFVASTGFYSEFVVAVQKFSSSYAKKGAVTLQGTRADGKESVDYWNVCEVGE